MTIEIEYWPVGRITPYDNNPRINDDAVQAVANSIRDFGFRQPIVVDADGVIIAGHTRLKAAIELGLDEVPVVVARDMTPEQARAYRLADNKTAELAEWDYDALDAELQGLLDAIDMAQYGFKAQDAVDDAFATLETFEGTELAIKGSISDSFVASFTFPKTEEDAFNQYVRENGKDGIVAAILDMVHGGE